MMSLTPTGTPASGPGVLAGGDAAVDGLGAAASASSSQTVRNAPTRGSTAAMRASAARVSSTDETSRRRTRAAASRSGELVQRGMRLTR